MINIIEEKEVKTRKNHTCFGCNMSIPMGSIAHVQVDSEGGKINRNYTHPECQQIMEKHKDEMLFDFEYSEGCVAGYLQDIDFAGTPEDFIKWAKKVEPCK